MSRFSFLIVHVPRSRVNIHDSCPRWLKMDEHSANRRRLLILELYNVETFTVQLSRVHRYEAIGEHE